MKHILTLLAALLFGTAIHVSDGPTIEAILAKTKANKHGLRSLIHEVVASKFFQTK